jgi:GH15 family glucan-1,4-alpha-glucosidase
MISSALVGTDGSIDWCCLPRFDSPSVFAALLDDERGGRFQIRPSVPYEAVQSYLPDTNVLQTEFRTAGGRATVTDFMPCYQTIRYRVSRLNELHRLVDGREGRVPMEVIFEPRMDYGRGRTSLRASKHGVMATGKAEGLALSAEIPFAIGEDRAVGSLIVEGGQGAGFVLRYGRARPRSPGSLDLAGKLDRTTAYWKGQADGCFCPGPWRDHLVRSYLTLHLLTYSPTGAIIAAPTTSLPEEIGGVRNWDYRYTWLRDASLTMNAFLMLGHEEQATGIANWIARAGRGVGMKTNIVFDLDFGEPPAEEELDHLGGYRDSRPVRVGNDAYRQVQLDVYGEVLEVAHSYFNTGGRITRRTWDVLKSFVNTAADEWQKPDSGIWEVRGGVHHFVHSKLMCWSALDRGIKIAERMGRKRNLEHWRKTAHEIREDILARGWNPQRRAFTQHYDTTALDASNLLMALFDFLPISDPRVVSTIEQTMAELSTNGLLHRYRASETSDGIAGSEGAFLWCSFWLARNLLRLGMLEEAESLYQRLLGYGNHLGLFPEMVDPTTGEAMGNFPQALTHLAVIIAGLELTQAMKDR